MGLAIQPSSVSIGQIPGAGALEIKSSTTLQGSDRLTTPGINPNQVFEDHLSHQGQPDDPGSSLITPKEQSAIAKRRLRQAQIRGAILGALIFGGGAAAGFYGGNLGAMGGSAADGIIGLLYGRHSPLRTRTSTEAKSLSNAISSAIAGLLSAAAAQVFGVPAVACLTLFGALYGRQIAKSNFRPPSFRPEVVREYRHYRGLLEQQGKRRSGYDKRGYYTHWIEAAEDIPVMTPSGKKGVVLKGSRIDDDPRTPDRLVVREEPEQSQVALPGREGGPSPATPPGKSGDAPTGSLTTSFVEFTKKGLLARLAGKTGTFVRKEASLPSGGSPVVRTIDMATGEEADLRWKPIL